MGCYNQDVLFIHIPKCAGWSVKKYLQKVLPDVLMPDDPRAKLPIGHVRLQDLFRFTGRDPKSFKLILAVVRDPYEQQLSQWQFWRDRYAQGQRHLHDVVAASCPDLTTFLEDPRCDFHVWYEQHYAYQPGVQLAVREYPAVPAGRNRYQDFSGIFRYWITVDDEIPENVHVLRAETLDEELPEILCDFDPAIRSVDVPRLNTSPHGTDVRAYYTPRAAQLVEEKAPWAFAHYYEKWSYSSFA